MQLFNLFSGGVQVPFYRDGASHCKSSTTAALASLTSLLKWSCTRSCNSPTTALSEVGESQHNSLALWPDPAFHKPEPWVWFHFLLIKFR